jgi:hypothetical protein
MSSTKAPQIWISEWINAGEDDEEARLAAWVTVASDANGNEVSGAVEQMDLQFQDIWSPKDQEQVHEFCIKWREYAIYAGYDFTVDKESVELVGTTYRYCGNDTPPSRISRKTYVELKSEGLISIETWNEELAEALSTETHHPSWDYQITGIILDRSNEAWVAVDVDIDPLDLDAVYYYLPECCFPYDQLEERLKVK